MAPLSCPSSEMGSSSEEVPETDAEGPLPPLMSYSPTSPPVNEPQTKPDPPQPVSVNAHKPLPQTPMSRAIRAWLQQDYKVCPEEVERHLRELQTEKPMTKRYKLLVDHLRTLLHNVPSKPYRHLVSSLPLELRSGLRIHILRHPQGLGDRKTLGPEVTV
ncbi:hypothetical protein ABVT39_014877 [Epinephelus coioides]